MGYDLLKLFGTDGMTEMLTPAILKIGELWRIVSPIDAWFALAGFLTNDDLQKFKEIFLKVFKTIDPALELEPEKRYMAAIYGKTPVYSWSLIKGISQTLILIAVSDDDDKKLPISTKAQTWVDNIISFRLQI